MQIPWCGCGPWHAGSPYSPVRVAQTLMPLRTAMNWQYRHGATTTESIRKLYAEDGIRRFYRCGGANDGCASCARASTREAAHLLLGAPAPTARPARSGIAPALVQAPLSRFGDTASNAFALTLLADVPVPVALKTVLASTLAAGFRIALVPVDTLKTVAQVRCSSPRNCVVLLLRGTAAQYLLEAAPPRLR